MIDQLENNIHEHGFDAAVDAASWALRWALEEDFGTNALPRYMTRPDAERRAEWIARGGNPAAWPDGGEP